ncbi:MAG: hypothetical protein JRF69_12970 [Deltaproteobacteria bacterium]|nr:hypothetical protein [Deltaproteobacteria bacterium]
MSDAFQRYVKHNNLPVDNSGFIETKRNGILSDLKSHQFSFEASAYLSLSVTEVYEHFKSKFILLVRRPDEVVNSYITKRWYEHELVRQNDHLAPHFQPGLLLPHHSFSRIVPVGDEAKPWNEYTRIGKLSWFWTYLNRSVITQLQFIPKDDYRIVKLEDLDYQSYRDICAFIGFESVVPEAQFHEIAQAKPNFKPRKKELSEWTDREKMEFENEVKDLAIELAYEWKVDSLLTA